MHKKCHYSLRDNGVGSNIGLPDNVNITPEKLQRVLVLW